MQPFPTPYPEVNVVINALLPEVQAILGDQFTGMYLYGSLAYGDFDTDSDVDFIVVTREELSESLFSKLKSLHERIAKLDSWCATQLEGSYTPRQALLTFDPLRVLHIHIDRGQNEHLHRMLIEDALVSRAWWGGWVLLRSVLWENGITLAGPEPRTLIGPVSPDDLKQASLANLPGWAELLLDRPEELVGRGYQSYVVLTLCRMLYTLEYGRITSKPEAARWAQEYLGPPWSALIERAWVGRHTAGSPATPEDLNLTLEFIRFIARACQKFPLVL